MAAHKKVATPFLSMSSVSYIPETTEPSRTVIAGQIPALPRARLPLTVAGLPTVQLFLRQDRTTFGPVLDIPE